MERIKRLRYPLLPFLISAIFFIIPFFWLKPGTMDLGGDSSRLYFYDPIHYLFSQSLFSISHSGLGAENSSYYAIPLFLLLALSKSFIHSSTLLISGFHGMSLSIAFISCYLIVKSLIYQNIGKREHKNKLIIEMASMIAGIFYNLSPVPILGWGYVLLTYNQVFLNPLMFFLLLRFFTTSNIRYMLVALLISFIFSPNFTYVGAPSLFAFYPLAFLFLLSYTKYIRHVLIPWKKLMLGVLLFFLLHSFHLIPQIISLLSPGSQIYQSVFSSEAKFNRGLEYFSAIASGIKDSLSLLSQPQLTNITHFSWLFIVFPALFVLGFIWNKRKAYLLTGIFFLVTLFFYSANITKIGFTLYIDAFNIPGFSMFRNFYGQWQWVYLFFYTILLGQALATVLVRIKKWKIYGILSFIFILLIITSWPFINGTLADTKHWQSKNISTRIKIDPKYEKVLAYLRGLPVDGKILSLPLTDPGYQVLKGENNAAYEGPSTITYLAGRDGFMGLTEFDSFGPSFLQAVKERNYLAIRDILSMLNIRYIFYNDDPYIFTDNFPGQPYGYVSRFLPDTQPGYKEFIKSLGVKEIKTIAGKYHIYEFDDASYLPRIYMAGKTVYWNDYLTNLHTPLSFYGQDKRIAFFNDNKILTTQPQLFNDVFLKAQNNSAILDFFKVDKFPRFVSPAVSRKLSSRLYPLIVLREKIDLARYKTVSDAFINRSVYFMEKRVNELTAWSSEIPIRGNVKRITYLSNIWREPKLWEFWRYGEYNSWEVTLVRYERSTEKLIDDLGKTTQSNYSVVTNKVALKKDLMRHRDELQKAIHDDSIKSTGQKKYLLNLVDEMFVDIFAKLNFSLPDYWNMPYEVKTPLAGVYKVYLNKEDVKDFNPSDIELAFDGKMLSLKTSEGEWIEYGDVNPEGKPSLPISLTLHDPPNLTAQTEWKTIEQLNMPIETNNESGNSATLTITNSSLADTGGLIRDIQQWTGDSVYIISFDYLTYNQNFSLSLYEKGGTGINQYTNNTYNETLWSKEWKKFNTVILSQNDARSAFLQITKDIYDISNQNVKKIDIKNLSVVRVPDPQIILKNIVRPKDVSVPQIIFTKINPTKYKVTIHGAKDPYALILSEKFDTGWKIFLPDGINENKTLKGFISRVFGKIMASVLHVSNIVISSEASKKKLTSYFNNDVIEGMHKSIFLDQNTFETFGQNPIAEETHSPVNGYANAWYINPKDVRNKEDYELIMEMTSQKLSYIGLLISIGGLFLLSFVFLKLFRSK